MRRINFKQVKNQNFYTGTTPNGGELLKSYNTIVGYITNYGALYRVRYTHTTGKQITQYYNNNYTFVEENYISADELNATIKAHEGFDTDTKYNGQLYNSIFID